ncbi:E3 ubiquitin/ISG15 ligase TRIM25 isoform X3 [Sardina pilchardus]|uniref:E3 ubiquitin/ISG15 ligase TRIM25 isoform X3 n=1 Tax=Sardina pilchardus TaxID=27697 RepID=UPI002E13FA37
MSKLWTEEQFNCPVCLDLPTDPTTIPCGHSYCMDCITDFWDNEKEKNKTPGAFSCPECRQTFSPRPQLSRNTMLAEAMEQVRKGSLSSAARDTIRRAHGASVRANASAKGASAKANGRRGSGGGGQRGGRGSSSGAVPCDQCLSGERDAVKTCLVCMASFCEVHLKPHRTSAKLKGHETIAPTADIADKICAQHKYLQEFYCKPCHMYVCWLCTSNNHKGHDTVSTQAQRTEKQKELEAAQTQNQQRLQERQKELKDMKKVVDTLTRSSDKVQEDVDLVLGELQQSVQKLLDLVGEVMLSSGQEKIGEAQDVVQKLEAEVRQLKKRETASRDLIRSQDNIYFLQKCDALVSPVEESDLGSVSVNPDVTFDWVKGIIRDLRDRVEVMCNVELNNVNQSVFDTEVFTVTKKDDKKAAFLKLFSGIGKPANARAAPTLPSVSVRGLGNAGRRSSEARTQNEPRGNAGRRSSEARTQNEPRAGRGAGTSPRPTRHRQATEDREEDDTWSVSSLQRPRRDERETANTSPQPQRRESRQQIESRDQDDTEISGPTHTSSSSHTPQRQTQDQSDTWSISSMRLNSRQKKETVAAQNTSSAQNGQPQERAVDTWSLSSLLPKDRRRRESQQSERGERWSLSSLLPKNRRKREETGTVRELTPDDPPSSSGLWDAQSTQVNPGLFLDTPTPGTMTSPGFPALREIDLDSIQAPEPRTREDFLQYACVLTLDPCSAHRRLVLSEGNSMATLQPSLQVCADRPERFDGWTQVVCVEPLTAERCYWEVEWRGRGSSLGVALASMPRKGADSRSGLGYNGQSWSLELSDMCCAALHANQKQEVPVTYSPRVGIFLDRPARTLAFYGVDEELAPLHAFRSPALAQPLYAAFGVGCGLGIGLDFASGQFSAQTDSIKICPI